MEHISCRDYRALLESHRNYAVNPGRARRILLLLVLEGALVFALVIALCILLLFSRFFIFGFLSLLTILFSLWRISRFRVSEDHVLVNRKRYRMLYRRVNYIAHLAGAPKVSRIYISLDFNAASFTRFSLIPGLRRTTLSLGYPLLAALSRRAIGSVIAHELGHLARHHTRKLAPVYSTFSFWEEMPIGIFGLVLFLWRNFYLRRLALRLPPLRREHEVEADRFARDAFGAENQAEALGMMMLRSNLPDQFIEELACREEPLEELDLCRLLREKMTSPLEPEFIRRKLQEFLRWQVAPGDDHPPFRERTGEVTSDRLEELLINAQGSALSKMLPANGELEKHFQRLFEKTLPPALKALRENRQATERFIAEWNPEATHTTEEEVRYIGSLCSLGRLDEARPLAEKLYHANPESPDARFCWGMTLYTTPGREKEALPILLRLLEDDPAGLPALNDILINGHFGYGTEEEMLAFLQLRDRCVKQVRKGVARGLPKSPEELSAADIAPELRERLREALKRHRRIQNAWIVTRPVLEGSRFKVLFVILHFRTWSWSFADNGQIKNALNAEFGNDGCLFVEASKRYCRKLPADSELDLSKSSDAAESAAAENAS